jgi:sortase A
MRAAPDAVELMPSRLRRSRRRARWRVVGVGLVLVGLSLLCCVGYEVWGTGLQTARAQSALRGDLAAGFPSRAIPGRADGFIRITRLALDVAFLEGVDPDQLAKGPGHYPGTPLPGSGGNVAIAGHRTTHGAPFWGLNILRPGDVIELQTRRGTFIYSVVWQAVVSPNAAWVTARTRVPSLTLTTCNPRFSSTQRLVVRAVQIYSGTPREFIDPHLQASG